LKRSGWLTFSGIVLIVAGIMRILDGIWAFRYNGTVVDNLHQAIFGHSLTTYGWLWLIVGIVLIGAGLLVMGAPGTAAEIARWIGIVAAALGAVTAISWMPYYPVWSLVYVGIGILVIYGLVAHWDEEAPAGSH
jgi:uncharacterized membrane protein HdeD (DUF308 family)